MTLQAIQGSFYWPSIVQASAPGAQSQGGLIMDAAGERCATIVRVPKSGTLSNVGFKVKNVVAGPHTLDIRLETVDASGNPTGTLVSTGVETTKSVSAGIWYDAVLDTAWTEANGCTRGTTFAIVFRVPTSGTPDVDIATYSDDAGREFPYSLTFAASVWTKSKGGIMAALEYSDGSYEWIPGLWPFEILLSTSFNSTNTVNRVGNRFRLPFPCTVDGCWLWIDKDSAVTVKLLNDGDAPTATPLAEVTASDGPGDSDYRPGSSGGGFDVWMFDTAVDLTKDTWYRLVVEPEGSGNVTLYTGGVDGTVGDVLMDSLPGGQDIHRTQWDTTPTASWTNATDRRVQMGLMISRLDDGVGGGGGSINRGILTGSRL